VTFGVSSGKKLFPAQTVVVTIALPKIRAFVAAASLIKPQKKFLQPTFNEMESSMVYKVALIPGDGIGKEIVPVIQAQS